MNSAFIDNQAATKAVRIARVALRGALACALVFGAGTAFAQQYGGDRRDDQQHQSGGRERFSLPPQDRGQRDAEMRAYEEQRRAQQQSQQQQQAQQDGQGGRDDGRRGSGRLTPDERRDLRRQINEAGMDLYQRRR
ncbi:MAG: hypothetical protein EOO78_03540 [Oxalobacteraceae bacterium]|nr:MAG: hypothetical protein EOO78_03540 [Oxalobacteraceae bacterium]